MAEEKASQPSPAKKRSSSGDADSIMAMMNKTIDIARLQFKRVQRDLDEYHHLSTSEASVRVFDGGGGNEKMSQSREIRTALFADVHFLLISLHEAEGLFSRLKKLFPQESELSNLHNRYRPVMKRCKEFRIHMEHVDGKETEDLGRLAETIFTLRGKDIDLGPSMEKDLETLFSEIVSTWTRISERQRKIREFIVRRQPAA